MVSNEPNNVIEKLPTGWSNSQESGLKYMLNGKEIYVLVGIADNDNLMLISRVS